MDVREEVASAMVTAAKTKDREALSALRMIKAALHNREIDLRGELTSEDVLQVLSSMVKQRRDSIEQFKKGDRSDLVEKEERELAIIQGFMPAQLSQKDIEREIEKAIVEAEAAGIRDMGKVMKILIPKLTGKADGKAVSEMVRKTLSS
ncbi:MAG: GatB/YqeY domain-containing protein [Deltaproteobacteria bacterium]|nr:GatB/YqeY domain-containing protein [Deltaproteobacteria bacterium]